MTIALLVRGAKQGNTCCITVAIDMDAIAVGVGWKNGLQRMCLVTGEEATNYRSGSVVMDRWMVGICQ